MPGSFTFFIIYGFHFFFFNTSKVSLHGVFAKQRFVDPNGNYTYQHTLVHPGWTGNERMTLPEYFLHLNVRNVKPQVL